MPASVHRGAVPVFGPSSDTTGIPGGPCFCSHLGLPLLFPLFFNPAQLSYNCDAKIIMPLCKRQMQHWSIRLQCADYSKAWTDPNCTLFLPSPWIHHYYPVKIQQRHSIVHPWLLDVCISQKAACMQYCMHMKLIFKVVYCSHFLLSESRKGTSERIGCHSTPRMTHLMNYFKAAGMLYYTAWPKHNLSKIRLTILNACIAASLHVLTSCSPLKCSHCLLLKRAEGVNRHLSSIRTDSM